VRRTSRLASVATAIARFAKGIGFQLGRPVAVIAEFLWRTYFRFDSRVYSQERRVKAIIAGDANQISDKFAILVIFAHARLARFTADFIDALNNHTFNVIVVSNSGRSPELQTELQKKCCLLIERDNFARDFGAYKDAIAIVLKRFKNVRRLVLANDSVYYLRDGLDELITGLEGPGEFIGVSESFQHYYHVASFLISFGPAVLASPAFAKFWDHYRPIPTRQWAIVQGEGGLTKCLMQADYKPQILFQAERLRAALNDMAFDEMRQAVTFIPREFQPPLHKILERPVGREQIAREFCDTVINLIMPQNQMHIAGFLFVKYLGLPLFKRDIVYRGLFSLAEAERAAETTNHSINSEIRDDLARRVAPTRINVLRRLFYRHGLI
jgi:hypothetical protein